MNKNKQDLIEKIRELDTYGSSLIERDEVLELIRQLDEPQKVVVPQFVADFITEQKKLGYTLSYSIDASMSDIVAEWYWDNSELFALAWIFGYEVEEEKRYTIVMKETKQPLYYNAGDKKLFFSLGGLATKFTRKQLEDAGFGWVFDCEGIEIEEVVE